MFRQKIDDLTNCSCRLLPNQPNQYMIFKSQNSHSKPINKEHKQKFSLKSQVASSNKQQYKVISAQKTSLKAVKLNEEEKHGLSKQFNSNKQNFQKNLICSPENSQVQKVTDNHNHATTFGSEVRSFTKIQNSVKTAQNNKMKLQKKGEINSQKQDYSKVQQNKNYMVSNFGNQSSTINIQKNQKKQGIPKKSLNFEDYYKYVSNPYAANEKNKENFHNGDNPQTSRYKIDLKLKKQYRKFKNQSIPLQQINRNVQTNVFHQSLEKYENSKHTNKGTFIGSMTTKNSISSHNDSMKGSKNQVSLMNSNVVNFTENPSLQFFRMNSDNHNEYEYMQFNQSDVFSQKNMSSTVSQRNRNHNYVKSIMGNQSEYMDNSNNFQPKIVMKYVVSQIQRPLIKIQDERSEIMKTNEPLNMHKRGEISKNQINKLSPVNRKILIEKMNTFTDIINNTAECESVLGQGEKSSCSNEQSVVILRYKDLVEQVQGLSEFDHNVLIKPQDLELSSKIGQKQKDHKFLTDSSNLPTTSIKPTVKHISNLVQDSAITCDQNMKKTLKYNQHFTHQFNLLQ